MPLPAVEIPGFRLKRTLSDREHSLVFLAVDEHDQILALKLEKAASPDKRASLLHTLQQLQPVTRSQGFLPILTLGEVSDGVWYAMPLADPLPGLTNTTKQPFLNEYTPHTLRAWISENGHASASQAAFWGSRIARALAQLHTARFVHRDVKPGNLLFLNRELCIGDYGLAGRPGERMDLRGTEGFIPLEGTSDRSADVFALAKTLYEAWSGRDRFDFPSLPVEFLKCPEWSMHGRQLNQLILRACDHQPSRRFSSALEFADALDSVLQPQSSGRLFSRRRWLGWAGGAASAAVGGALLLQMRKPKPTALWRRIAEGSFNKESWNGHAQTVDWKRRRLYSICKDLTGFIFMTLDLSTFRLTTTELPAGPGKLVSSILNPDSGALWAVEGGTGDVYTVDVDTLRVNNLGGGPEDRRHYMARLYWNGVTRRVGTFGGYGMMSVNNERHEFATSERQWVRIRAPGGAPEPWPRTPNFPMCLSPDSEQVFLLGGCGSPSGKQGEKFSGLRDFNSQFYMLDDAWQLDLRANQWRQLLPVGWLPCPPSALKHTVYHPSLSALILLTGTDSSGSPESPPWLVPVHPPHKPAQMRACGDVSTLSNCWAAILDPRTQEILVLADDGIFSLSIVLA